MNRITITSVFAFLTAAGSMGCLGQSTTTTEGSGTYEQTAPSEPSSPRSSTDVEGEQVKGANGQPVQTLELEFVAPSTPPGTEQQGPFPEPWIRVMGPFPEPWNGNTAEPAGTGSNGNDPNNP